MCWLQQSAQLWSYPTFLLVPLMVVAGIECFLGYRAWRFLLGVNGAVLGFIVGVMVAMTSGAPMLVLVGAVGGAVAGGVLFAAVLPVGSFVFAFGSAASLTILLARIAGAPPYCIMTGAFVAGVAGAVAVLAVGRPFMISIAAVAGAQQLASAWRAYHVPYGGFPLPDEVTMSESAAFIALAAMGLLLQFATSPAVRKSEELRIPRTQCRGRKPRRRRRSGPERPVAGGVR
jgi:hypothetical protein